MQALVEWFAGLPDALRVALIGFAAERLTQLLKGLADKLGWSPSKLQKLILAILSAAVAGLVAGGVTSEFWGVAAQALLAAVFLHEAGATVTRAVLGVESEIAKQVKHVRKNRPDLIGPEAVASTVEKRLRDKGIEVTPEVQALIAEMLRE